MMILRVMPVILLVTFFLLSACTQEKSKLLDNQAPEIVKEIPTPGPTDPTEPPPVSGQDPNLNLCSKLDLADVVWPSDLTVAEWTYYALALNITGSFEGVQGWKNIAGNSDGQGMSLGLMQQNLGQGTLQPWLIEMFKQYNPTMVVNFSTQNYKNLKSMLESWQNSAIPLPSLQKNDSLEEALFPRGTAVNELDIGYEEPIHGASNSSNSVQWAKQNILDSRGNVLSQWKTSFQNMAISPGYRSFQLAASTTIFFKARQYFNYFGFRELRSLLFLFDIVVQNGSIQERHLEKYEKWLDNNAHANEQAKTLALLEARLTTVKPQYVQDVRSRKSTIIYGTGTVHQTPRNLPQEYCFDPYTIVASSMP